MSFMGSAVDPDLLACQLCPSPLASTAGLWDLCRTKPLHKVTISNSVVEVLICVQETVPATGFKRYEIKIDLPKLAFMTQFCLERK